MKCHVIVMRMNMRLPDSQARLCQPSCRRVEGMSHAVRLRRLAGVSINTVPEALVEAGPASRRPTPSYHGFAMFTRAG